MPDRQPPSDDVLMDASAWLARLRADNRKPEEEQVFQTWLQASPDHAQAFEAVDNSWAILGGVSRTVPTGGISRMPRRALLMSGVGFAVVAAGTLSFVRSGAAKVYETGVGEQKHVALEDGSRLFLNARTRVSIQFDQSNRVADLEFGRVNFFVRQDAQRPFVVEAGQRRIVSQQCSFDVHREDQNVQIVLLDGTAKVMDTPAGHPSGNGKGQILHAGDRFIATADHYRLDRPNLKPLIAWQVGRAVFDDEPLMEAVQEMNLYCPEKLEIADSAAGRLRVSGVYHVGDNLSFARSISRFLPVSVHKDGDRLVLSATSPVTAR